MSLEIRQSEQQTEPLTPDDEAAIVRKLCEIITKGTDAMAKGLKRKKRIIKAYECQHEDIILKRNGSKAFLPWVYTAHESAQARLSNSLVPNDEDTFSLVGETDDDQPGCDMLQDYMKMVLNDMGFISLFDDILKELLFGEVVVKVNWLKVASTITMGVDPNGIPQKQEDIKYNNVYAEVVNCDNFVLWPVIGDLSRATCGHRVWRHKDELLTLQEQGIYNNVDSIQEPENTDINRDYEGLEVWEFWIPRINVNGRIFRNYIATVVEKKTLVRFEANSYDYGLVPFIYAALIKNYSEKGLQNTGHGLTDRAYEIQKMANFIVNQVFDESKVKLFGFYKYVEDGVFNPGAFVARAGGLVKVGDPNNLQPVNPNIGQISFGMQELEYLDNQFQTTTGVPKFMTGQAPDNPNDTATAKRLQAEGADSRFRALARRINETVLKPMLEMFYVLIRQMAIEDQTIMMDIARRTQRTRKQVTQPKVDPMTGQPVLNAQGLPDMETVTVELSPQEVLAELPVIPPLSKIDVKVVGFENVLNKADNAAQFERFINGIMGVANVAPQVLDRIKLDPAVDYYARSLSVESDILRNDAEMAELQIQKQQQAQQAQQNNMQMLEMASRMGVDPKAIQQVMAA